jgi:hypothetical protein
MTKGLYAYDFGFVYRLQLTMGERVRGRIALSSTSWAEPGTLCSSKKETTEII